MRGLRLKANRFTLKLPQLLQYQSSYDLNSSVVLLLFTLFIDGKTFPPSSARLHEPLTRVEKPRTEQESKLVQCEVKG